MKKIKILKSMSSDFNKDFKYLVSKLKWSSSIFKIYFFFSNKRAKNLSLKLHKPLIK